MPAFAQAKRQFSLSTPLGADVLLAESFQGTEGISELFEFHIEVLAATGTEIDPSDIIGKRVTLTLVTSDEGTERTLNGMVASLESLGSDWDFDLYRLRVVPTLWLLSLNTQTRVFQNQTVVDIVKAVLTTYSITPQDDTQASYTTLEYCTQYRETDLQFVSRLMEQHGIFYYFTHTSSDHTMVLADTSAQLSSCPGQSTFRFEPNPEVRGGFYQIGIDRFSSRTVLATGQHTLWDYRFSQFAVSTKGSANTKAELGDNSHEFYEYTDGASSYLKTESGDGNVATQQTQLQNVQRDLVDAQTVLVEGNSNAIMMQAAFTFTLSAHPQTAANLKYLLTRVQHSGYQSPSYRSERREHPHLYRNTFTAQPASLTYRAPRTTPKPRVMGVVTGKVVAPSGDDSYLDKYGRVCVQFWWDRNRKPNTTDNTLLRVAQQWAGKGWGTYFWPRINDEVLIDFMDGDPDAPIVVGSLYNGTNMPKYDPASEYTRAGILTQSSKNGAAANANELRFDDLKGSEQIFINAEKNLDIHVEDTWHTQIDNEQHLVITKNRFEAIKGDSHSNITGKNLQEVDGDLHLKVGGKQVEETTGDKSEKVGGNHMYSVGSSAHVNVSAALNEKIGSNYSLQVGANSYNKVGSIYVVDTGEIVHIKAGTMVVIEGGEAGVCLSGPGGFVSIGPEGVTIQGILVNINSGGAALQGPPAVPQSPEDPTSPDAPTAPKWVGDDPRSS